MMKTTEYASSFPDEFFSNETKSACIKAEKKSSEYKIKVKVKMDNFIFLEKLFCEIRKWGKIKFVDLIRREIQKFRKVFPNTK